jgi:hypothetical protein
VRIIDIVETESDVDLPGAAKKPVLPKSFYAPILYVLPRFLGRTSGGRFALLSGKDCLQDLRWNVLDAAHP